MMMLMMMTIAANNSSSSSSGRPQGAKTSSSADDSPVPSTSTSTSTSASLSSPASSMAAPTNNLRALEQLGKSSNSSNETVIALEQTTTSNRIETLPPQQQQQPISGANLRVSEQQQHRALGSAEEHGADKQQKDAPRMIYNQDRLRRDAAAAAADLMTNQTQTETSQTTHDSARIAKQEENDMIGDGGDDDASRDCTEQRRKQSIGRLRAFLLLTRAHLNPFNHHHQQQQARLEQRNCKHQVRRRKQSLDSSASSSLAPLPRPEPAISVPTDDNLAHSKGTPCEGDPTAAASHSNHKFVNLFNLAQRCFFFKQSSEFSLNPAESVATRCGGGGSSRSAPVTPIKWNSLTTTTTGAADATGGPKASPQIPNGLGSPGDPATGVQQQPTGKQTNVGAASKPSVRFVESCRNGQSAEKLQAAARGNKWRAVHTQTTGGGGGKQNAPRPDSNESSSVANLFKLQAVAEEGESPMNSSSFRQHGYSLIDYISNYLDTIKERRVTPLNIEPGYLKDLIEPEAPARGESFANIMPDFENHIMCGITHWQHPHFHAYFPAGNAYPSILADMLSDALGCVGFSWAASPAYTELEIIMLDWMGKMIGLPDEFLCLSGAGDRGPKEAPAGQGAGATEGSGGGGVKRESKGGGVIQGSASECVLVNLLAARHWAMEKLRKRYPNTQDGILLNKLIGYCSKEAHSCVEKAAMIGFIRMRALDTDEQHSLRGETLEKAIAMDRANGLEPFLVCATLGTTSCVSFDNLAELGPVCRDEDLWLHVDAAYAGSALICPEFQYLMKGIELATSFNMNPNKWMLINFDCSLMWVKDRFKLTRAFVVDPLYLQHSFSDQAIDYRHWGIPLSRRFRALKLWFVIRNYGIEGLQAYIRNHVRLAKLFEQLIRQDSRFTINNQVVLGLVCFRLIGSNALNQRLLSMINASGKLHMVPASLEGRYVIRFCVCDQNAKEEDIRFAYECIGQFATELFDSIRAGKERIRAISQQNTIDVSSVSLHTQQSASADRLNRMATANQSIGSGAVAVAGAGASEPPEPIVSQQQRQEEQPPVAGATRIGSPNREAARQYLMASRRNSHALNGDAAGPLPASAEGQQPPPDGAKNLLLLQRQASVKAAAAPNGCAEPSAVAAADLDHDDLEQEIVLDSLASIDGYDYDLDDDDDDDIVNEDDEDDELAASPAAGEPSDRSNSTSQRRRLKSSHTMAASALGERADELEDEVFHLAKERRNRMSLRYKREFFVRVVSDPRVYRASISGDINASCNSLGNANAALPAPAAASPAAAAAATTTTTTTSVSHQ